MEACSRNDNVISHYQRALVLNLIFGCPFTWRPCQRTSRGALPMHSPVKGELKMRCILLPCPRLLLLTTLPCSINQYVSDLLAEGGNPPLTVPFSEGGMLIQ